MRCQYSYRRYLSCVTLNVQRFGSLLYIDYSCALNYMLRRFIWSRYYLFRVIMDWMEDCVLGWFCIFSRAFIRFSFSRIFERRTLLVQERLSRYSEIWYVCYLRMASRRCLGWYRILLSGYKCRQGCPQVCSRRLMRAFCRCYSWVRQSSSRSELGGWVLARVVTERWLQFRYDWRIFSGQGSMQLLINYKVGLLQGCLLLKQQLPMKQHQLNQLDDLSLKIAVSLPSLTHPTPNHAPLLLCAHRSLSQLRLQLTELSLLVHKLPSVNSYFLRELRDFLIDREQQMRSLRTEKDKHIEALKTVLEDNKKRNADFMRTIEVEFKKKEEVVDGLHRAVRELQERNRGLEEQNDKLVEELEQARRRLEDKQQQQQQESGRLDRDLFNAKEERSMKVDLQSNKALQVINQVTETCMTTQRDQCQLEDITLKFNNIKDDQSFDQLKLCDSVPFTLSNEIISRESNKQNDEAYDFRKDLQIVLKLSNQLRKQPPKSCSRTKPCSNNNFINNFRSTLYSLQQSSPTKTSLPPVKLDFPSSFTLTLLPLDESPKSDTQKYIGSYQYQGSFDQQKQRSGYGILRKNKKVIYEGDWAKGVFEGWGKLVLSSSKFVEYNGCFKAGHFWGRGTLVYTNGDKYIGEVVPDYVEGEGTFYRANGEMIYGIWSKNVLKYRY